MADIVRVVRILEYIGTRDWVEKTVAGSVHGTKDIGTNSIRATTLGLYPEIVSDFRMTPSPGHQKMIDWLQSEIDQAEDARFGPNDLRAQGAIAALHRVLHFVTTGKQP